MPDREWKLFLSDILQSCNKIIKFTEFMSMDNFLRDEKTFDAVMRNLEIIGEAVKRLPDDFRIGHPEIEWKKMAGLRDIVIHEYFGINEYLIWDIIRKHIPELQKNISLLV